MGRTPIGDKEENSLTYPNDDPRITAGDLHTEFLQELIPRVRKVSDNSSRSVAVCLAVANEMADKYGIKHLTQDDVQAAIQLGHTLASTKTEFTMEEVLSGQELEWWDRYSREATLLNARQVYEKTCALYGTPALGSPLEDVISITLSSAEFWSFYHDLDGPELAPAG